MMFIIKSKFYKTYGSIIILGLLSMVSVCLLALVGLMQDKINTTWFSVLAGLGSSFLVGFLLIIMVEAPQQN